MGLQGFKPIPKLENLFNEVLGFGVSMVSYVSSRNSTKQTFPDFKQCRSGLLQERVLTVAPCNIGNSPVLAASAATTTLLEGTW